MKHRQAFDPAADDDLVRPADPTERGNGPPPLPVSATWLDDGAFGLADEDGLRMLAALGSMTSLEPDYCDDFAAEASVTIIESGVDDDAGAHSASPDRRPAGEQWVPALLLDGYEPFLALGEEATVEIVEVASPIDAACAAPEPSPPRASLAERIAAADEGSRFLEPLPDT